MIGNTISHYKIESKIGGGGMGVVYRARDLKLDRLVALKFLPPSLSNDEDRKERFILEAKAASALDHPNIGTIYEVDETTEGQIFIAMAFYKGETLKKRLSRGTMSVEEALDVTRQVATGLAKVHGEDIIHRDIKPANVIVTEDGLVKILDFGLAKLVTVTSITGSGAALGTPAYMSPEQTRGDHIDARTDLWSLGVMLHEMLTGELPFKGGHAQAIVHAILNEEPRFDALRAKAPHVVPIVEKALSREPRNRYQSAAELLRDIDAVERGSGAESGVTQIRSSGAATIPSRKKLRVALAAVGLLVAVGFLTWRGFEARRMREALSRLEPLAQAGELGRVFETVRVLEIDLNDPRTDELARSVAGTASIVSDPPGVLVEVLRLDDHELEAPVALGVTPIEGHRLVAGEYLVRLRHEGTVVTEFLFPLEVGAERRVARTLFAGETPEGMIFVEEGPSAVLDGAVVPAFFIDRDEVTNADFLEFVAAGVYQNPDLWPSRLTIDGEPVAWSEAMEFFVDRTGIAGPRGWSGGTYPEGAGDHPVTGVCWYEAAAYARWAGMELPSWNQWWRAALGDTNEVFPWGDSVVDIDARAAFGLSGTEPVSSFPLGVSPYGCYDMAGNVREWLRGTTNGKRLVVGGAWIDPSYMFEQAHAEPFDPSYANEAIGFRCVKTLD